MILIHVPGPRPSIVSTGVPIEWTARVFQQDRTKGKSFLVILHIYSTHVGTFMAAGSMDARRSHLMML